MLLEQIYYFSQIAAAIGVIGSLVFVGFQVRGNARSVRSATTQAVHENFANLYFQLAQNPETLRVFEKGCLQPESLSTGEKSIFTCHVMALFAFYQNAFDQWRVGHLRQSLWLGWEALLENALHMPGVQKVWRDRAFAYDPEFRARIAELAQRKARPDLTVFGVKPETPPAG
jgi:hypothetical protein